VAAPQALPQSALRADRTRGSFRSQPRVDVVALRGGRSWRCPTAVRSIPLPKRSQFRGGDEHRSSAIRRLEKPRPMDPKRPRAVNSEALRGLRDRNKTGRSGGDLDGDRQRWAVAQVY
jgi:hypothetical protein